MTEALLAPTGTGSARGAETRQRIARAALTLFAERGVRETTIRDIAGALGMAEGALYRHFPSKDALAAALFTENYLRFGAELQRLAGRTDLGPRARLAAMVAWFCAAFDADAPLFSYLLLAQHDQLARIEPQMQTPVTVLSGFVAEAQAAGDLPAGDPELATAAVLGIVLQAATFALYGRLPRPLEPHAPALARAAWAALTATEDPR